MSAVAVMLLFTVREQVHGASRVPRLGQCESQAWHPLSRNMLFLRNLFMI